jgi:hypothetical protein
MALMGGTGWQIYTLGTTQPMACSTEAALGNQNPIQILIMNCNNFQLPSGSTIPTMYFQNQCMNRISMPELKLLSKPLKVHKLQAIFQNLLNSSSINKSTCQI